MKKFLAAALLFALAACSSAGADAPRVGNAAPAFTLPSQSGKPVSLADFRGKWVVLYFYPKDFTHGCSIEAHNFQSDIGRYRTRHAVVVGISADTVDSHREFCTKEGLGFRLLSDPDHKVSAAYDSVKDMGLITLSARHTFLIDPKGTIRKIYLNVDPNTHSTEVLKDLIELQRK